VLPARVALLEEQLRFLVTLERFALDPLDLRQVLIEIVLEPVGAFELRLVTTPP